MANSEEKRVSVKGNMHLNGHIMDEMGIIYYVKGDEGNYKEKSIAAINGGFYFTISNLLPYTTYEVKAFVKNGSTIFYSSTEVFLTKSTEKVTALLEGTWKWAGSGDTLTDFGVWSCGPKSHLYSDANAQFDYFDLFDNNWWKLGEYGGIVSESQLDDRYTFNLDANKTYYCDYDTSGILCNWAWVNYYGWGTPDVWCDEPVTQAAKQGNWELSVLEHTSDTIPLTVVNGEGIAKSYIISIKGGAFLGVAAYSHNNQVEYQICRIDADTLWVRYDNTYPQNLPIKDNWVNEGIKLGDPEWDYFYLVKDN
jgi:hypothetical protein